MKTSQKQLDNIKRWQKENPEKFKTYCDKYKEKNKEKVKKIQKSWRDRNPNYFKKWYSNPENKKRVSIICKKWRENNSEKILDRRIKDKERRFKSRFKIFERDNFTCQYCGRKAPEVILEIDHIYPKSKGGLNIISNYTTACRECNIGKGNKILK